LNKPGLLTDEEFEIMKRHVKIGVDDIEKSEHTVPDPTFFRYAKLFAGYHHERWDGTGYPHGLKGEDIPLEGRLMAIVDVYDAMTNVRPYKTAMSHEKAAVIIKEEAGGHFDPALIKIFVGVAGDFEMILGTGRNV
jgi:putative two-component system response regulator